MLRLSPLIPFNAFNYICGITNLTLRQFALAGFGMIPGTAVYVYIGASLAQIGNSSSSPDKSSMALRISLTVIGSLIALFGLIFISIKVKKILNKMIKEQEEKKELEVAASLNKEVDTDR